MAGFVFTYFVLLALMGNSFINCQIEQVISDIRNLKADVYDINSKFKQVSSCSCLINEKTMPEKLDLGQRHGHSENDLESGHDTLDQTTNVENSNMINSLYHGFKELKQAILVASETQGKQIQSVKEKFTDFEQNLEAIIKINKKQQVNIALMNTTIQTLKSDMKLLNQKLDLTDKLHQHVTDIQTEITNLEQRLREFCPQGWFQYLNNCYYLNKTAATWYEAIKLCQLEQAMLIEYETKDEVDFVYKLVKSIFTWSNHQWTGFYVGGSDLQSEGNFVWASSKTAVPGINWLTGQPDNGGSREHCMMTLVNQDGYWNDNPCDSYKPFVCKKELYMN